MKHIKNINVAIIANVLKMEIVAMIAIVEMIANAQTKRVITVQILLVVNIYFVLQTRVRVHTSTIVVKVTVTVLQKHFARTMNYAQKITKHF